MVYSLKNFMKLDNNYRKGVYVLGELVWVYEYRKYGSKRCKVCRLYEIIDVIDKNIYNMYICKCKHKKRKTKITITDQDYFCKTVYKFMELELGVEVNE